MAGHDAVASEIYKSLLMSTIEAIDDLICAENEATECALVMTRDFQNWSGETFEKKFNIRFNKIFRMGDKTPYEAYIEELPYAYSKSDWSVFDGLKTSDNELLEYLFTDELYRSSFEDSPVPQFSLERSRKADNTKLSKDMERNKFRKIRTKRKITLRLNRPNLPYIRCWYISGRREVKLALREIYKVDAGQQYPYFFDSMKTMLVIFKDNYLFSSNLFAISDAVYIAQHLINENQYQESVDILEKVVSMDYHHPLSVIMWPKELIRAVDDDVKSEILKSPNDYIALPSVVYALYLLARIYNSIGDREAFEDTKVRFEDVCGYLGDVSPISSTLLELVHNLKQHGIYEDFDLD